MRVALKATVSTTEQASKHAGPRTCLVAITGTRNPGVYAVSPAGACTYVQPLPKCLRS
ncbi:unnamed protein product [marine sediment metagenome]|uniref:Uncharacterized protein n=1 Tax=marine sediment metagenome TaxID=412755 RepID=X0T148_9ZZZZ